MNDQKKLLILVDGSKRSIQTLQYMGQMLPLRNFKLVVFHVFSGVSEGFRDLERTPHNAHTLRQMMAWENQRKKDIDNFTQNVRQTLVDAGFPENAVTIKIQNRQTGVARDILKEARPLTLLHRTWGARLYGGPDPCDTGLRRSGTGKSGIFDVTGNCGTGLY
jgi:hypothetical protein